MSGLVVVVDWLLEWAVDWLVDVWVEGWMVGGGWWSVVTRYFKVELYGRETRLEEMWGSAWLGEVVVVVV